MRAADITEGYLHPAPNPRRLTVTPSGALKQYGGHVA